MLAAWEFCGVIEDTTFDPACPVGVYDTEVGGVWVPSPAKLITSLPAPSLPAGGVDQDFFVGVAQEAANESVNTDL